MRRPDPVALVAGLVLTGLGTLLLLERLDLLTLEFAVVGPAVLAAIGAVLLASGLSRPR